MLMIGIRQFFTRQNFPSPDSSKFSTVKILRHTVYCFGHFLCYCYAFYITILKIIKIITGLLTCYCSMLLDTE